MKDWITCVLCIVVMVFALSSCEVMRKPAKRESIFDKVVSIPKELVLDIPKLPPFLLIEAQKTKD